MNIPINKQELLQLRVLRAWAMKFNKKINKIPICQTKQGGGVCVLVFGGLAPAEKKIGLLWAAASGPI